MKLRLTMLYVLHGDNVVASRNRLNELKKESEKKELREIQGKNCDITTLTQAVSANSLFGGETIVVVENLIGKLGRKTSQISEYAKIINYESANADIVLWEEKELSVATLKNFSGPVKNELFKLPVLLWQFLDTLKPETAKNSLLMLKIILETEAAELIWSLITKRLVQLLILREGVQPRELQSWQIGRLTSQAKAFTIEKLRQLNRHLLDAEYGFKSGKSVYTMSEMTERFVLEISNDIRQPADQ